MDKKSKVLLTSFIFLIIISVFLSYYKYIYLEDINFFTDSEAVPDSFEPIGNILKI